MFCGALSHMHCWDCSGRWQWLQKRCTFSLLQSRPGQSVSLIKYSPTTSSTYILSAGMLQPFAAVHTPAQANQFPATAPCSLAVWLCSHWCSQHSLLQIVVNVTEMPLLFLKYSLPERNRPLFGIPRQTFRCFFEPRDGDTPFGRNLN